MEEKFMDGAIIDKICTLGPCNGQNWNSIFGHCNFGHHMEATCVNKNVDKKAKQHGQKFANGQEIGHQQCMKNEANLGTKEKQQNFVG